MIVIILSLYLLLGIMSIGALGWLTEAWQELWSDRYTTSLGRIIVEWVIIPVVAICFWPVVFFLIVIVYSIEKLENLLEYRPFKKKH